MAIAALVRELDSDDIRKHNQRDKFLGVRALNECEQIFQSNEFVTFKVFDTVKVIVETTTEFPLDIKCTLVLTVNDLERYENLKKEQDLKMKDNSGVAKSTNFMIEEAINEEI